MIGAGVGIAVVIAAIVGITATNQTAKLTNLQTGTDQLSSIQSITNENAQTSEQTSSADIKIIGQSVMLDEISYTVTGVESRTKIAYEEPNGQFLVVTLTIENKDSKPVYMTPSNFVLLDEDNRMFSYSYAGAFLDDGFAPQNLNPGLTLKTRIVFDIPVSDQEYKLKITSDAGNAIVVKLTEV